MSDFCFRLVAAAVRVMKVIMAIKDDFYDRHLKEQLAGPVVRLLLDNGPRYNLLNSTIRLFDLVRKVRSSYFLVLFYVSGCGRVCSRAKECSLVLIHVCVCSFVCV